MRYVFICFNTKVISTALTQLMSFVNAIWVIHWKSPMLHNITTISLLCSTTLDYYPERSPYISQGFQFILHLSCLYVSFLLWNKKYLVLMNKKLSKIYKNTIIQLIYSGSNFCQSSFKAF